MGDAFKALSDPTRRRILELLQDRPLNAGEIADCFQMTKPSISHHLSILKSSGLRSLMKDRGRILFIVLICLFFKK